MQLKQQVIQKDGQGSVKLYPENEEDMWHVYNLIHAGDRVRATTVRCARVRPLRMVDRLTPSAIAQPRAE